MVVDAKTGAVLLHETPDKPLAGGHDFDSLIAMVKYDSITEVKVVGDPNDTSIVVQYDTFRTPILEGGGFLGTFTADSLRYVPYSGGKRLAGHGDAPTYYDTKYRITVSK